MTAHSPNRVLWVVPDPESFRVGVETTPTTTLGISDFPVPSHAQVFMTPCVYIDPMDDITMTNNHRSAASPRGASKALLIALSKAMLSTGF